MWTVSNYNKIRSNRSPTREKQLWFGRARNSIRNLQITYPKWLQNFMGAARDPIRNKLEVAHQTSLLGSNFSNMNKLSS